ncbi:Type IV secretion system protein virB3 [Paraburkholderia ultramafica]|uniref:Type IV secretion system protein virB3 n=1 Tax=Paraburkholderia ultramafica TaxID=1544867 RepID=A0A6S7DDR0_9BURK|nr:VirB3 family type IV secretion system protein [Paraburkholderia ultramafica]CAB3802641.1 Type IV secretion system protein virB3 [Paraburkholderia ultramafica]
MDDDIHPFPLFKGATRVPTRFGVPTTPLLCAVCVVAILAMWASLWCWLLLIPVIAIMRLITRHDDRAFGIWWLWFETKARNRNKRLWGGSSYAPRHYRRGRR